ncbi:MAG: TonB-dependent receptor plug domain-containing protein [Thermonemataceae bacterium]
MANEYGFYSLTLPKGTYTLTYCFVSYTSKQETIVLEANQTLNVSLADEQLETVVITEDAADQNIDGIEMGTTRLDIATLKKMPAFLGEVDVIRSIQMVPGVSTVGEGATGFNVRGGGVDQNLILLDEGIIYNSSHLLGFFSVFNPDAVKDVKLVKGGVPAQYGGRLSSLLDVRLKEGNSKRFAGSGGIGSVSSRLTLEAPINEGKGSFIVAGRRSYADLFLRLSPDEDLNSNTLFFYDLSAKANYEINEKNRVFLSGYLGRDVFEFGQGTGFNINWGNATATLRWNHTFNPKLFVNFTGVYSNYDYSLGIPEGVQNFEWRSDIVSYNAKADFGYYINPNHTLNFGANAIFYTFQPGEIDASEESIFNDVTLDEQNAIEWAAYVDHEYKINSRLFAQYGLRLSSYTYLGEATVYDYVGEVGERRERTNPQEFGAGEPIVTYTNLEPRISMRYRLNEVSSIKATYNRMAQYVHLISSTTAASPTDVWSPSTKNIQPQLADQVALGYFRNFKDNMFEASIEAYYKDMSNQIDYVDGAQVLLNDDLEGELLYGQGRSYGVELFIRKAKGRLNGWVSYTLSRSERQIDGINQNDWYPAKYDRTHNLSVVSLFDLNQNWTLGANFTYTTGVATTFPNARYEVDGLIVPHNTENSRNNYRVPDYHRLDFSATYNNRIKNESRKWKSSWAFSIYNVYGRRNPFTVYFQQNEDNPVQTEAVRLSIFASIIPSVTYNFEF